MLHQNVTLECLHAIFQFALCQTQTAFNLLPSRLFFQNFYKSYPYWNSMISMPQATTGSSQPEQSSGSPLSESSGSGPSTPTSEIDSTSTSTEENKKQDQKKGKTTAIQDRWKQDQVKYHVNLWGANNIISRLESLQSRKAWTKITSQVNKHFNLVNISDLSNVNKTLE